MSKAIYKLGCIIKKISPVKLISLVLAILLVILVPIRFNAGLGVKKQRLPQYDKVGLSEVIKTIENDTNEVLVAETSGKLMYIDTVSLNVRVEDIKSGIQWDSISIKEEASAKDKSPISIKYIGKDGISYEKNAYESSIQNDHYTINQIENGVQIVFDFSETGDYELEEYIPQKISIDRYEEIFIKRLEKKHDEGLLTSSQLSRYQNALKITYAKDVENNCYYQKSSKVPPTSLVKTLVEIVDVVDYTTDMLMEDSQEFGILVEITQPARFVVTMELTLDGDDLIVRVPTYEVDSKTQTDQLESINLLPSFGMASAEEITDGYILVPDGSGALFQMNTFNSKYPEYVRPIYNNTYYDKVYEMSEFPEDLHIPVFGMYYDNSISSQGFMGIVEEGAELGYINVQLGTMDTGSGGTPYNKVYSAFDAMQSSRVKVFGPYSEEDARYLATTGPIDVDYTVRYKLFPNKITYFDMAKSYRDHLISEYDLSLSYDVSPKVFFDIIGTLTIEERFLGVPYKKQMSMTEYKELLDILYSMDGINKVVNYRGFFNDGIVNTVANKISPVKVNGTYAELDKIKDYFHNSTDEIFYTADLMRISKKGAGFSPKAHALNGYDSKPIKIMSYDYSTGRFRKNGIHYYLLNPLYLTGITNEFLGDSQEYDNIFLSDMGATYYANYNNSEIVNPILSSKILKENLDKILEEKTIALENPNADKLKYGKYATNISRESSDYSTMYGTVPFRQLVMNGIIEYTTMDINRSYERDNYFILQALEVGSIPKYTISSKSADLLKNSPYTDYHSIQYETLKDRIEGFYHEYADCISKIGTREIVNHEMLIENVFKTTYESGVEVITNYNKYDVSVEDVGEVGALDYIIFSGISNVSGGEIIE